MVPAVIIMFVPAAVAAIPDPLHPVQGLGFLLVQFFQEPFLHLMAVLVLAGSRHLQGLVDQILLGRHDVRDIAQRPGIKGGGIHMHMDFMNSLP